VRGVGSSNLPVPTINEILPHTKIKKLVPQEGARLAHGFVLSSLAPGTCSLQQHQCQGKTGVRPPLAMPAAHRVLQQQEPLNIFPPEAGEPKI
jgi:hypothetical protein